MRGDRDIERAIKSGQRNKQASELIHNWCAHARVVKHGGVGMIEAETGLPIGHHSMDCDQATGGGFAGWDLGEAAVDFHDRNCVSCHNRSPRGIPNLSLLLGERDRILQQRRIAEEERSRKTAEAYAKRKVARDSLLASLPMPAHTVIEQLELLDSSRQRKYETTLLETARLAPESFSPALIEHLFQQLESGEHWLDRAGLMLHFILKSDPRRIVSCAMAALARCNAVDVACSILEAHADLSDPAEISSVLPTLVERAHPTYLPLSGARKDARPKALLSIWKAFPGEIAACIQSELDSRDPRRIEYAARAILSIGDCDPAFAMRFAKSIVALLVRRDRLIDFATVDSRADEEKLYGHLKEVLQLALHNSPATVDRTVESFLVFASEEAGKLVLDAYSDFMKPERYGETIMEVEAHRVVLVRLLTSATTASHGETFYALQNMLGPNLPRGLEPLARREMALLLGTAALLEQRREKFQIDRKQAKDGLASLDASNNINAVWRVQKALIEWASSAAAEDPYARSEYLQVLSGAPEQQEDFRAALISSTAPMLKTVDGMNAVLPHLYAAIVGSSNWLRQAAVSALKEIEGARTRDLPRLVHEALVAALGDPFVIVHRSAVEALQSFRVEDEFLPEVRQKLLLLILVYGRQKKRNRQEDEFLVKLIDLFAPYHLTDEECTGPLGCSLLAYLSTCQPDVLIRKIRWVDKRLRSLPTFAKAVVELYDKADSSHDVEDIQRLLREVSASAFLEISAAFVAAAKGKISRPWEAGMVIELLSQNAQWEGSLEVASLVLASIADTPRNHPTRLAAKQLQLAVMYEAGLAKNGGNAAQLESQWYEVEAALQKDKEDNATRRNFLPGVL